MKVVVREFGQPGLITTVGRMNARAGAKALADLLVEEEFADLCTLNIDWEHETAGKAILLIDTVRWFPQYENRRLEHSWPLDIDDLFSGDNADNSLLRDIVVQLKEEFTRDRQPPREVRSN